MSTFRNVFGAIALLFVGLAVAPNVALADENFDGEMDTFTPGECPAGPRHSMMCVAESTLRRFAMSTFRNILAMALFLFVGLAVVPSAAMAEDVQDAYNSTDEVVLSPNPQFGISIDPGEITITYDPGKIDPGKLAHNATIGVSNFDPFNVD